jgi:polysaccharide export outer membrane protein
VALCVCIGLSTASSAWAQTAAPPAPGAATTTAAARPLAPEFKLGPGDSIRISVYQNADLSMDTRLTDSGLISYPLLGSVQLGGLSVAEAAQRLADGLRKGNFIKDPQVSVTLVQVRGSLVSVLGQVNKPGRYPLELADTRLSDVLAQAGGVVTATGTQGGASGSDIVTVIGERHGKPFRASVDLPQVFRTADATGDITLMPNDVVWVDRAPVFYIYGEVQRPGPMRLERDMTLLQALADDTDWTVRWEAACRAVGSALDRLLRDAEPEVRQRALERQRESEAVHG